VRTVRDKADLAMPVIAKLDFADGTSEVATQPADVWFGGARTFVMRVPLRGRTVKSVALDPDNRFQDLERADNSWPRTP
jgi:hypothetical protein